MSRHSKNCTATTHFTYNEKVRAGHGTLKRRFGKDSQIPFGTCCLSLTQTKNPMVSPSGYIYDKEAIYENMLAQKQAILSNLAVYEKYLEKKQLAKEEEQLKEEQKDLGKFLQASDALQTKGRDQLEGGGDKKSLNEDVVKTLAKRVGDETKEEGREVLKRTSFWMPEFTPESELTVEKPDERTKDPMTGEPMKLKHLMPAKFVWSDKGQQNNHVLCVLTKKPITHQAAVLLKPSGQIVLESCLKDMVLPNMLCPITGVKLRKKDIIHLQCGGSSYSAHSQVEAKKYRPSMT